MKELSIRLIVGCALLCAAWIHIASADTLQAPDTTVLKPEVPLWSDSALAFPDTLAPPAGVVERWLIPLGVILVSGAVAVALYAVRSR
jgi:hypothetical protein